MKVVQVFLLLTLNIFHTFFSVCIVVVFLTVEYFLGNSVSVYTLIHSE